MQDTQHAVLAGEDGDQLLHVLRRQTQDIVDLVPTQQVVAVLAVVVVVVHKITTHKQLCSLHSAAQQQTSSAEQVIFCLLTLFFPPSFLLAYHVLYLIFWLHTFLYFQSTNYGLQHHSHGLDGFWHVSVEVEEVFSFLGESSNLRPSADEDSIFLGDTLSPKCQAGDFLRWRCLEHTLQKQVHQK